MLSSHKTTSEFCRPIPNSLGPAHGLDISIIQLGKLANKTETAGDGNVFLCWREWFQMPTSGGLNEVVFESLRPAKRGRNPRFHDHSTLVMTRRFCPRWLPSVEMDRYTMHSSDEFVFTIPIEAKGKGSSLYPRETTLMGVYSDDFLLRGDWMRMNASSSKGVWSLKVGVIISVAKRHWCSRRTTCQDPFA